MARSIKSRRGKANRRVLRDRFQKKKIAHLVKIVEKAKENDKEELESLVYLHPKRKAAMMAKKMEEERVKQEEAEKMEDGSQEEKQEALEKEAAKKMKKFRGNIEVFRGKGGNLPCWVSQRQIRKNFFSKKNKKNGKKCIRNIKLV